MARPTAPWQETISVSPQKRIMRKQAEININNNYVGRPIRKSINNLVAFVVRICVCVYVCVDTGILFVWSLLCNPNMIRVCVCVCVPKKTFENSVFIVSRLVLYPTYRIAHIYASKLCTFTRQWNITTNTPRIAPPTLSMNFFHLNLISAKFVLFGVIANKKKGGRHQA